MSVAHVAANVKQAVPFFGVTNMEASLKFYVGGLGFTMKCSWIPDRVEENCPPDGRIRWCWLQRGEDALALYREFKSREVQMGKRPFVGNRHWVVSLANPDGYRIEFESPTDAP